MILHGHPCVDSAERGESRDIFRYRQGSVRNVGKENGPSRRLIQPRVRRADERVMKNESSARSNR